MDKTTRAIAIRLSVLLFFIMALTGWCCGHEPAVCTARAVIGAATLYLIVRIAGNLVVRMLIETMADEQARRVDKHY